jgi:hypothetical protein
MLSFTGTRIVRFRPCPRRPILPTLAFSDAPPVFDRMPGKLDWLHHDLEAALASGQP